VFIQRLLIYVSTISRWDRSDAKNQSAMNVSYILYFLPPKRKLLHFWDGINDNANFVFLIL